MRELDRVFRSPPQGGNGRGVRTHNAMALGVPSRTVQAQPHGPNPGQYSGSTRLPYEGPNPGPSYMPTNLRGNFENGVYSARAGVIEARHTGAPDMRNFAPGFKPAQVAQDPSPVSTYDYESEQRGPGRPNFQRVVPVLEPNTTLSYRVDGKPVQYMPR